jgi:hypothetical protein
MDWLQPGILDCSIKIKEGLLDKLELFWKFKEGFSIKLAGADWNL